MTKEMLVNKHNIKILKRVKSGAGFTLIELIVVFAIIAVLSTLGVASFVSYSRSQTLNSSASDLVTILNLAKSRAQSQVKPSSVPCNNFPLDGYEVKLCGLAGSTCITAGFNYELDVRCGGSYGNVSKGKLPHDISFGSLTTTTSIFFPVLTGGIQGSGTIAITGYSQTRNISVDVSGNINQ